MKLPWATTAGLVTDGPTSSRTQWLHSLQCLQRASYDNRPFRCFWVCEKPECRGSESGDAPQRLELSLADRSGMGVRLPGWLQWTLLLWRFAKGTGSFCQLCRCRTPPSGLRLPLRRSNRRRRHGQASGANRFVPAQCMGDSRHARKRKRDLRRRLPQRAPRRS